MQMLPVNPTASEAYTFVSLLISGLGIDGEARMMFDGSSMILVCPSYQQAALY